MNESPGLRDNWVSITAAVLALFIVAWIPAAYLIRPIDFAVLTPAAHVGLEAASAIARLFAALVLLLLPKGRYGRSIRWLAAGFVVLGVGSITFGSFPFAFGYSIDMGETVVGSLVVSTVAGILFLMGLLPERPRSVTWTILLAAIGVVLMAKLLTLTNTSAVPTLWANRNSIPNSASLTDPLADVTFWYWVLVPIPLIITIPGVVAALIHYRRERLPGWLVIALIFWTGSQLHNFFWPSTYNLVVTTTDVLRFMFAMVIVVAGIYSLHQSAQEYARLLDAERQLHRQLALNASLKNDFTRMVAHELGSPVAAISRYVEIAQTDDSPQVISPSLQAIKREASAIGKLVTDIQAIATIESDDFSVRVRPVPIDVLVEEARVMGVTFERDHPFQVVKQADCYVMADSVRIGQVLRNLLDNAVKYSPRGTPIVMSVTRDEDSVSFEIQDQGYGIAEDEIQRVFDKYERGEHGAMAERQSRGAGLGLYLSRQIVRAHGSDIQVQTTVGEGSTFRFTLEVAR